jgi:hypothetical protein
MGVNSGAEGNSRLKRASVKRLAARTFYSNSSGFVYAELRRVREAVEDPL